MLQVVDESETTDVNGRVAAMVRIMLRFAERIAEPDKVKVEFNAAGSRVRGRIMPIFDDEEAGIN